jgi:hypothetical protein
METPRRQTSVQRAFAALGAVLAAALPALAGDRGLVDTSESAHATMYMADLADAKWTGGMWGDRFDVCSKTMIPHMWDIFQSDKDSHAWANFRIAARLDTAPGAKHVGPPFADGDFFKWFEGVAQVYAITRDPELDRLMDGIIEVIAKAQRGDGYFGTGTVIPMREGVAVDTALADREHFETYNMGHLMTAACVHYRATGKTTSSPLRGRRRTTSATSTRNPRRSSRGAPSAPRTTWGSSSSTARPTTRATSSWAAS